jgi:hypothetical protein
LGNSIALGQLEPVYERESVNFQKIRSAMVECGSLGPPRVKSVG